jgi:hypothetical protein
MASPNADDHRDEREDIHLPVSRRTLLQTGALASATVMPVSASGRAASKPKNKGKLGPGDAVIDREDSDPDAAVVLDLLDVPISDWNVFGNETVADQNPRYNPKKSVVIVAFESHLDAGWPDWGQAESNFLFEGVMERGIKFHAFPRTRLRRSRPKHRGGFSPGATVVDGDDSDPDRATVLTLPGVPISDWTVFGNETVADHNPGYESDEPVVIVVFEHLLDTGWPDWDQAKPNKLFDGVVQRGIKFHAFPKGRLDSHRKGR